MLAVMVVVVFVFLFFFFFKQKTAYELRISDWSSDVCSSDLLHLHWLCAYDPNQNGSAPLGWHRDFADARLRLRDWVATCGTRLDRDRPTRQATWPGEEQIGRASCRERVCQYV